MALPEAVTTGQQQVCREIISSFERADKIHPFSPYTMFVCPREIAMGGQLTMQEAMRLRNPGRGYTPRKAEETPGRRQRSRQSSRQSARGKRDTTQAQLPRVQWSTETRGSGLGYKWPNRVNPAIGDKEREFRDAFSQLQTSQKQKFIQKEYFCKYKAFDGPTAPKLDRQTVRPTTSF